jgi:hypothetical protein
MVLLCATLSSVHHIVISVMVMPEIVKGLYSVKLVSHGTWVCACSCLPSWLIGLDRLASIVFVNL